MWWVEVGDRRVYNVFTKREWHIQTQKLSKTLPGRWGGGWVGSTFQGTHMWKCSMSLGESPRWGGGTENTGEVLSDLRRRLASACRGPWVLCEGIWVLSWRQQWRKMHWFLFSQHFFTFRPDPFVLHSLWTFTQTSSPPLSLSTRVLSAKFFP